jgi:hypothetical protein
MTLPLHGDEPEPVYFEPEPSAAREALEAALSADGSEHDRLLRDAVASHPTLLEGWARLAEHALAEGRAVDAYAYARVGYHRGLDRARQSGWRGTGPVPPDHPPNAGFVRSVWMLGRAATAISEADEAERCDALLADLDRDDALEVR